MTSSVKDPMTSNYYNSSRSGVVVSYQPEDTMKSLLFNQITHQSLDLHKDDIFNALPHGDIEKALQYLSSDTESESSVLTKSTIRDALSMSRASLINAEKITNNKVCKTSENSTGADVSNFEFINENSKDSVTDKTFSSYHKSFDELVEEKLRQENNSKAKLQRSNSTRKNVSETKFSFLRKNSGRAAWSCNMKSGECKGDARVKGCSYSSRTNKNSDTGENSKSKMKRGKSLTQPSKVSSTTLPPNGSKGQRKVVHFALSCDFENSKYNLDDGILENNQTKTSSKHQNHCPPSGYISAVSPSLYTAQEKTVSPHSFNQTKEDKELIEFELLEQIANVSISSTSSSIARFDEETMREKLRAVKSMPPPEKKVLNKIDSAKTYPFGTLLAKDLSVSEENHEAILSAQFSDSITQEDVEETKCEEEEEEEEEGLSSLTTSLSEYKEANDRKGNTEVAAPLSSNLPQIPVKFVAPMKRKVSKHQSNDYDSFDDDNDVDVDDDDDNCDNVVINNNVDDSCSDRKLSDNKEDDSWIDRSPFFINSTEANTDEVSLKNNNANIEYRPSWTFADPFQHQSYNEDEDEDLIKDNANDIAKQDYSKFILNKKQLEKSESISSESSKLKYWVQVLEKEIKRFNVENEEISKLKKEREDGLKRLEEEMAVFEKYKEEETKKFEEFKLLETKKLKKERKVFEEYQEALKNMPSKKDRMEIEKLKSENDLLKNEMNNKENRWQSTNGRLKQRIEQLESENNEMRSRIHNLEQKRLQLQSQLVTVKQSATGEGGAQSGSNSNKQKAKPTVTSVSQAISFKHTNIPISSAAVRDDNGKVQSNDVLSSSKKGTNPTSSRKVSAANSFKHHQPHQKPVPSSTGIDDINIRESLASDYCTGEEEVGDSQELINPMGRAHNQTNSHASGSMRKTQNLGALVKIDRSQDVLKDEIKHPDGIVERIYVKGGIDVFYPNGSMKQISDNGKSIIVHLYNGDVKQVTPDGRVIYFYSQDESTQTTHPNGKEEIIYKNGHKEIHYPNGLTEVHFPDGSVKMLHPDSTEENILSSGLIVKILPGGDKEILMTNGQKEIHSQGVKKRIYPDGTTKTVYPDGKQETYYSSGRYRLKDKSGTLLVDKYIDKTKAGNNT